MSGIRWALASERAAGMGGAFSDTLNRALRDVLSQSGYDPDAATLPGLHGPIFNVKSFGAKGDGTTNDAPAIQAAVNAAGIGGRVWFPAGNYYCATGLTGLDFQTWEGPTFYFGAGGTPQTQLKFSTLSGSAVGITTGANPTFKGLLFRGPGGTGNTCQAILSSSGQPRFWECGFYSWYIGHNAQNGYYIQYFGCEWAYTKIGVQTTGCYNMHHYGSTFRGGFGTVGYYSNAIVVTDGIHHLALHGGSLESYDSSGGIQLAGGSLLDLFGVYFESSETASASFGVVCTGGNSTVNLWGNQVYLTNANRWFNASSLDGITLNSRGNKFVCASGSVTNPTAYVLPTNGTSGTVDIAGDDWTAVALAAASYVGGTLNAGPKKNFHIVPPMGVTAFLQEQEFMGRPILLPKLTAAPTTPMPGGIYLADGATWNPLSRSTADPYFVMHDGSRFVPMGVQQRIGTATYDPPSIAAAGQATTTVGVTGCGMGDMVDISFSQDLQGISLSAYVSAVNTVTVVLRNGTAGALDLGSGTLRAIATRY